VESSEPSEGHKVAFHRAGYESRIVSEPRAEIISMVLYGNCLSQILHRYEIITHRPRRYDRPSDAGKHKTGFCISINPISLLKGFYCLGWFVLVSNSPYLIGDMVLK